VISFSICDIPLAICKFSTDLGVIVDSELKFSKHINEIVVRAKQRAAIIHRCFLSRNVKNLILAFKTYVRPVLEYAPQIWSPYLTSLINLVESVQRSFTKRLPGFSDFSYAERLIKLKLQSLQQRRLISDLITCYNIVHGFTALKFNDFFVFSINTKTRGNTLKLAVPLDKTDIRKYFFASRVIPIWNSLPAKIVTASSTKLFKNFINSYDLKLFLDFPCILNL
jgi:hypothetical protein